jgi:hypothetical protein
MSQGKADKQGEELSMAALLKRNLDLREANMKLARENADLLAQIAELQANQIPIQ